MHNEFTAVFERDGEWYIAYCPEIQLSKSPLQPLAYTQRGGEPSVAAPNVDHQS